MEKREQGAARFGPNFQEKLPEFLGWVGKKKQGPARKKRRRNAAGLGGGERSQKKSYLQKMELPHYHHGRPDNLKRRGGGTGWATPKEKERDGAEEKEDATEQKLPCVDIGAVGKGDKEGKPE